MTKLEAYESALALYGAVFSQIASKEMRYFLGAIKRDFVFFLFALIWKGARGASELKSKGRLIPRNFNEWSFGKRAILLNTPATADNPEYIWNIDRDYFRANAPGQKTAKGIAVLGSDIDLEKTFDLADLARAREISIVSKKSRLRDIQAVSFFLENFIALFFVYRALKNNCAFHCSLVQFLRYFIYYAFASARMRAMVQKVAANPNIGKIMSSDLDNVIGNSLILWSRFYGLAQIAYPHGSPLVVNKNRYFEPEEYYIWTTYQQKYSDEFCIKKPNILYRAPQWVGQPPSQYAGHRMSRIVIVTAMEENLEIPFGERDKLIAYIESICRFAREKNIDVCIKSHKLLDWHADYDKLCQKYSNLIHVKKRWRIEQLLEVDIGVFMNTSTTMALQMMSLGIPIITCKEVMSEITHKHFRAPYFPHIVNSKEELIYDLEKLRQSKDLYRNRQIEATDTFLKSIITENSSHSVT